VTPGTMPKAELRKDSKIYVAGHRGLLGSAVVRRLKMEGYGNLLLRTSGELDLMSQRETFEFLKQERPDFVFVCAAKVGGIKANMDAPAEFLYRNLAIQNNVIEGSRLAGVTKLLFVGSSCIYPKEAECPIQEDALLTGRTDPTNEGYALAKISGIRMCQFYRRQYGCDYISAIPTNLFGINDHYDLEKSHLLPALIMKIHRAKMEGSKKLVLWGSGRPRREFMLSDDCADALVFLMKHYSGDEPINVGVGEDRSIVELAQSVARTLETEVEISFDSSKPDGTMRKLVDTSRLQELGWNSITPLDDAIRIAYRDFLARA